MKSSLVSAMAIGLAAAAPLTPRAATVLNDGQILNYALTLEHLEDTFYQEGLANYTESDFAAAGFDSTFYKNLQQVASDEKTHVKFLTDALTAAGVTPVKACTYSFPITDAKTFAATAAVLEGVGTSAYLGAAADIMSKTYLTAAGSILTTEARHSSYLRASNGEAPVAQPFDNPLDFNEVYSLASQFIVSCPSDNPALPLKPFPLLMLDTTSTISSGSTITLSTPTVQLEVANNGQQIWAAFITVTGPIFTPANPTDGGYSVKVPEGIAGQSYVVLNSCNQEVSDDTIAAGPAIVEIAGTV